METVYAEKTNKMGHKIVVPMWLNLRLLLDFSCVHRTRHQHRPDTWIWVSIYSRDGADAALPYETSPPNMQITFSRLCLLWKISMQPTHTTAVHCGKTGSEYRGSKCQMAKQDHSKIIVTNWKDKRNVYVIATNNDGADVMRARTKFRQEEMITIPSVITSYNKYMGGVDHCDLYRAYYKVHVGRTGRRWWKYLFWGLFNQALVNAYILWELSTRPHKKTKAELVIEGLQDSNSSPVGGWLHIEQEDVRGTCQTANNTYTAKQCLPWPLSRSVWWSKASLCVLQTIWKDDTKQFISPDNIWLLFLFSEFVQNPLLCWVACWTVNSILPVNIIPCNLALFHINSNQCG